MTYSTEEAHVRDLFGADVYLLALHLDAEHKQRDGRDALEALPLDYLNRRHRILHAERDYWADPI